MKRLGMIVLVLFAFLATGCACDKKEKEPQNAETTKEQLHLNTSADLIKEQTINDVKFSKISLLIDAGTSKFSCAVTNVAVDAQVVGTVVFAFQDKDGNALYTQEYPVDVLAKGEETKISFTSDLNLSDATSLAISIK